MNDLIVGNKEKPETPGDAVTETRLAKDGEVTDDIEAQYGSKKKFMEDFFAQIKQIQNAIEYLKLSTRSITELKEKSNQAIGTEEENRCSAELQKIISQTSLKCTEAKAILKRMKDETDELIKSRKGKQSELRIRRNLLATHTQKFVQTLRDYQQAQTNYKQGVKQKLIRRVKIVKSDITESEVQKVLEMGDVNALYQALILDSRNADKIHEITDAYKQAADKYQDVIKLERNLVELRQMFVDVALLVSEQGEMLNKIEYSVNTAEEYVEKGNRELVRANKARRAIRKKYFILALIAAVLLLIVLGPLLT